MSSGALTTASLAYNPYGDQHPLPSAPPGDPNKAKSSFASRLAAHFGGQFIGFVVQAITTVAVARFQGSGRGILAGMAVNTVITPMATKYLNEDTSPKWYVQMPIGCVINPTIGAVSGLSLLVGAFASNPYAGIALASLWARVHAYNTP